MEKEKETKERKRVKGLLRREILRAKAARLGLSFERKVELAKQRCAILNSLTEKDDKANKAVQALKATQKKYFHEAEKLEAEAGFTKAANRVRRPIDPRLFFKQVCEKKPRFV